MFSHFEKWNLTTHEAATAHIKRNSGSVCGLDPEYCNDIESNKWPDDITKWPICEKPTAVFNSLIKKSEHMYCEIIGRPCCVGIQGECVITTGEHCSLMRGFFHENANLCSQVDCMQDVCGKSGPGVSLVHVHFHSCGHHTACVHNSISVFYHAGCRKACRMPARGYYLYGFRRYRQSGLGHIFALSGRSWTNG